MAEQPPIKPRSRINFVLWWILVIACCLWAVLELAKGHMLAAGAFVAAAIVAMPPTRAWLKAISAGRIPGWVFAAVPFVFWLIAAGNSGPPTLPRVALPQVPSPRTEPVDVVANVVRFQAAYIGASDSCKRAFQAVADEGQSSGPRLQQMYDLAERAESQCRAAREVIGNMKTPVGLTHAESGAFQQAVLTCEAAYRQATETAGKLKEALDAGFQPSKVAAYQQSATTAVAGRQSCEAQIAATAESAVANHRDRPAPQ